MNQYSDRLKTFNQNLSKYKLLAQKGFYQDENRVRCCFCENLYIDDDNILNLHASENLPCQFETVNRCFENVKKKRDEIQKKINALTRKLNNI